MLSLSCAQHGQQLWGPNRRPCRLAAEPVRCTTRRRFLGNTAHRATRRRCTWYLANTLVATARFGLTPFWAFAWSRRRLTPFGQALVTALRKDMINDSECSARECMYDSRCLRTRDFADWCLEPTPCTTRPTSLKHVAGLKPMPLHAAFCKHLGYNWGCRTRSNFRLGAGGQALGQLA